MDALLNHIQKQIRLSEKDKQIIAEYFTQQQIAKKAILLKEGSLCKDLYFVVQGCLRLYFIDEKGKEQITHFAIENWWLTDYLAFHKEGQAAFNIQAIEPSTLLTISHQQLEQLTERVPLMDRYLRYNLQTSFGAAQRRVKYMYENTKEQYFREFIDKYPEFVQRVPQYMLASFLDLTPEYLSELRKKYK